MTPRTSTYLRRLMHATRLAAAGAITAGGAMMLTAPAGNAIPESTIISECFAAGGTYTTTVGDDGKRHSKCCYRDINGVKNCDNYLDGTYTTTDLLEQPPTSPPPPPPGGVVGPPATAAESAPPPEVEATLWMPPPAAGPASSAARRGGADRVTSTREFAAHYAMRT